MFKRKKLLNRLVFITLCTTLIPLIGAGIYLIPKIGREYEKAARDRITSNTFMLSHYLKDHFVVPFEYFLQELQSNFQKKLDIQVGTILNKYPEVQPYLSFVGEISNSQSPKIWFSKNPGEMKNSQSSVPWFSGFNPVSGIKPNSYFVNKDSLGNLQVIFATERNTQIVAQIDLKRFYDDLNMFIGEQNIKINFGIFDRKKGQLLYSNFHPSSDFAQILQANREGDGSHYLLTPLTFHSIFEWNIVTEYSGKQANLAKRNLWLNFGMIILFGLILSLLGTTYYLKNITGPLNRFAKSATEIARGNFNQRIQLDSEDEIGKLARIFNYMTIEVRRLNNMNLNKIISERTKTKTIIKNIGDGIIVTDEKDRIITVNVAVEKWFGIRESEVVDKPIRKIIKEKDLIDLIEDIKETDLEGTFTRDLVKIGDEANEQILQARATKLLNQENRYMGVVAILRDVTREKEIDRMKTELVSMVAHELRSPLTSISGFAELLLSPAESTEAIHEYASVIRVEAGRLADLVNKFLDISKIEAGRMDYKPAIFKIKQLTDSIFHVAVVQAQKKNIKLVLNLANEDLEIYADEKMFSEVILNLLSNAIKYSPENTKVRLKIYENNLSVFIDIIDQGFGISEAHLPNIFKKFYRIKDDPRIQEERGTGLGLTLVKQIVELHKGKIDVTSQIGKGTTFTINLPKPKAAAGWQQ